MESGLNNIGVINPQQLLQKSKTGKGFERKYKSSANGQSIFNSVGGTAIKEEDGYYDNTESRPITQGIISHTQSVFVP